LIDNTVTSSEYEDYVVEDYETTSITMVSQQKPDSTATIITKESSVDATFIFFSVIFVLLLITVAGLIFKTFQLTGKFDRELAHSGKCPREDNRANPTYECLPQP